MKPAAKNLVLKKLWLAIGYTYLLFVIVMTLIPEPDMVFGFDELFKLLSDKAAHFTAYALLMGWFVQIYHAKKSHFIMALSFTLMGVVLEYLQGIGQTRMFEVADMVANGTGVVLGWSIAYSRWANMLNWFEQRLNLGKR